MQALCSSQTLHHTFATEGKNKEKEKEKKKKPIWKTAIMKIWNPKYILKYQFRSDT